MRRQQGPVARFADVAAEARGRVAVAAEPDVIRQQVVVVPEASAAQAAEDRPCGLASLGPRDG